jgi:hypothetical protein
MTAGSGTEPSVPQQDGKKTGDPDTLRGAGSRENQMASTDWVEPRAADNALVRWGREQTGSGDYADHCGDLWDRCGDL